MARRDLYTGKAGEHAVISHLLIREWQVAAPEVDIGDDLLIAKDLARVLRVQVKTCHAKQQKTSYVGRFRLSVAQVSTPRTPELFYVFALFRDQDWFDFLLIPRRDLHDEHALHNVGSGHGDHISLNIRFKGTTVRCGKRDWSRFRANWAILSDLPSPQRTA